MPTSFHTLRLGSYCALVKKPEVQSHPMPAHVRRTRDGVRSVALFCLMFSLLSVALTAKATYDAEQSSSKTTVVRRDITDQYGTPIAVSVPAYDLWLLPGRFWSTSPNSSPTSKSGALRRQQLLESLSAWPQIQTLVAMRLSNYAKSDQRPKILAWGIPPGAAEIIRANEQENGLWLTERLMRHYPQGELFAHALGFVSRAEFEKGLEGIELVENEALLASVPPNKRNTLQPLKTLLDPELQRGVTIALNDAIANHKAIGGAAVIVEVSNGALRSMVSSPSFDANNPSTLTPERTLNRARLRFPIGHLLTPMLAAQYLESGRMQVTTQLTIGKQLRVGKHSVSENFPTYSLSLAEVVAHSSDIGAAKMALGMSIVELRDLTQKLGIGIPLRIAGIPGSIDFEAINWARWVAHMHAEPGRYISTTLLEITQAYLSLANDGMQSHIRLIESREPASGWRIFSGRTVNAMRNILSGITPQAGTAYLAPPLDVMIATKAFSTFTNNGHPLQVIIGMAPANNPRYLIGMLFEYDQQLVQLASNAVTPVVSLLEKDIAYTTITNSVRSGRQFTRLAPSRESCS